jgi:uncharacterized damage-inducible protein DinB
MARTYRKGPVGAMMDEYERASGELIGILEGISDEEYGRIRDTQTQDDDCRSIETIMTHVIRAGYGYAGYMRTAWNREPVIRWSEKVRRADTPAEMRKMLAYTVETLEGHWDMTEKEASGMRMATRWGQTYDFEQLFEHAIVHVLRHRRQIDRFLGR